MMFDEVTTWYYAQKGSSQLIRLDDRWHVIKEVWQGSRIVNIQSIAAYDSEDEARDKADEKFGYLTPAEAAEMTGNHESHWRNLCANGQVIGAIKKGKQWLIPRRELLNILNSEYED